MTLCKLVRRNYGERYKHTTCIPRWNNLETTVHVVSTWNTRGVFVRKSHMSIKYHNLHSFKEGMILLCQSILETRRISYLHGSFLFTIPLNHWTRLFRFLSFTILSFSLNISAFLNDHCKKYLNFHTRKLGENYGIFRSGCWFKSF